MRYQNNQHFSHHHVLLSLKPNQQNDDEQEEFECQACERPIQQAPYHACLSCKYYLHDDCLNTPRFLKHPSHPNHSLTLIPTPTYSSRSFSCDACGSSGHSFSLSCAECEFDLHLNCANLPKSLLIEEHPDHQLKLIFDSPDKANGFECDVCNGDMIKGFWIYYCEECDFGTHLDCGVITRSSDDTEEKKLTQGEVIKEENVQKSGGGGGGKKSASKGGKSARRRERATGEEEEERSEGDELDYQNKVLEGQRKMREKTIAHRAMLEALDNAASYVGPSSRTTYYYY